MRRVSERARQRMVRAVRDALSRHLWGGELWFDRHGRGGTWYSRGTMPPDRRDTIIVQLRPDADSAELVDAAVQAWEEGQA